MRHLSGIRYGTESKRPEGMKWVKGIRVERASKMKRKREREGNMRKNRKMLSGKE